MDAKKDAKKRKEIGRRLERRRVDLGRPRTAIARACGVSRWTWMRWVAGQASVPAESVPVVAQTLACDIVWLLTGHEASAAQPVKSAA